MAGRWIPAAVVIASLGAARAAVVVPVTLVAALAAAVAARRIGAALLARLPSPRPRVRLAQLGAALALAGGAHAALVIGELRLRPDPTYQHVMATERSRAVARELAAWRAAHPTIDAAALREARTPASPSTTAAATASRIHGA